MDSVEQRECKVTRAGTLGYQKCWRPKGHEGLHKSQDMREWGDDDPR